MAVKSFSFNIYLQIQATKTWVSYPW